MKNTVLVIFLLMILHGMQSYSQILDTTFWITNGPVLAAEKRGNNLYIGGSFTHVGPFTGHFEQVDTMAGAKLPGIPRINGAVNACISDGAGGWFIAGKFTLIGKIPCGNLVHILSDNTVAPFYVTTDDSIFALAMKGDTLFVGGKFSNVNGSIRKSLAAVKISTAQLLPWAIQTDGGAVRCLGIYNNNLYIGGAFSRIGGVFANKLASFNLSTNLRTSWAVGFSDPTVYCFAFDNDKIIIGGDFTYVGGQSHVKIAKVDLITGVPIATWNPSVYPSVGGAVRTICVTTEYIFAGGSFFTYGATTRNNFAAFDNNTGEVNSTLPEPNGTVNSIVINGSSLFMGGSFTKIGVEVKNKAAALDILTGNVKSWNPQPNEQVNILCWGLNSIYIGGKMSSFGGLLRNNLASLDVVSGECTSWNPDLNATVSELAIYKDKLIVVGGFTSFSGQARQRLATYNLSTNQLTSWNPGLSNIPFCMLLDYNMLYLSGNLIMVDGQERHGLVSFDLNTQQLTPLFPTITGGEVFGMAKQGNILYVAGNFADINYINNTLPHNKYLSAIDVTTSQTINWFPNADHEVWDLKIQDGKLYAVGEFSSIGGQTRIRMAAFDLANNRQLTNFNAAYTTNNYGNIYSMSMAGNTLFAGGNISYLGGAQQVGVGAVDVTTGQARSWNNLYFNIRGMVNKVFYKEDIFVVGGTFEGLIGKERVNLAIYRNIPLFKNMISGKVYIDENLNCQKEPTESVLPNSVIKVEPGSYYTSTNQYGEYAVNVDTGMYIVTQMMDSSYNQTLFQSCPGGARTVSFHSYNNDLHGLDFANGVYSCKRLKVDIQSNRFVRCFRNQTVVSYKNLSYIPVTNVEVKLIYPMEIIPLTSTLPWSSHQDSLLSFTIGTLQPGEERIFTLTDSTACRNNLGMTQCIKAMISPVAICQPLNSSWDGSSLEVKGNCAGLFVKMSIKNQGTGSMIDSSEYRVFADNNLIRKGKVKLNSTDSLLLNIPANGQTIRVEADQRPFYPTNDFPRFTVENCGSLNELASSGFYTQVFQNDNEFEIEYSCLTITGSHDPNEKAVQPSGITSNHYVRKSDELEYTIHFQNTGTDTAYTVVIRDTLDSFLDVGNFNSTLSSHPCIMQLSGKGLPVVSWQFDNINLPPASTDSAKSIGFVHFRIGQKNNNSIGTVINNTAAIYFDYNEPIITNRTFVQVNENIPESLERGNYISEGINPPNPVISIVSVSNDTLCINGDLTVGFTTNHNFNPNNQFIIQLSDSNGSFSTPLNLQVTQMGDAVNYKGTITSMIPSSVFLADSFKVRVVSSVPAIESDSDGIPIQMLSGSLTSITGLDQVCIGLANNYSTNTFANTNYNWSLSGGGSLNSIGNNCSIQWAADTGYVVLSCTPTNFCPNNPTLNFTIHIKKAPEAPSSISGSPYICPGETQSYQAFTNESGVTNYSWTVPSGYSGSSTTESIILSVHQYSSNSLLSVLAINSCGMSSQKTLILENAKAFQKPMVTLSNNQLQTNYSSTEYTWIKEGMVVASGDNMFEVQDLGAYAVVVKNPISGCEDTSTVFNVLSLTGLLDQSLNSNIDIYPNPAFSNIVFSYSKYSNVRLDIEIINSLGKVVHHGENVELPYTFYKTASLPNGIYSYKIKDEADLVITGKIIFLE